MPVRNDHGVSKQPVYSVGRGSATQQLDAVVVEEPLLIRLQNGPADKRQWHDLTTTMRTPGQDAYLAAGLLFAEGIIAQRNQLIAVRLYKQAEQAIAALSVHPDIPFDPLVHQRMGFASSSCGVCGKVTLDYLEQINCFFPKAGSPLVPKSVILQLSKRMRNHQALFPLTGGIHAAALFDAEGNLLLLQEDIGRHNAVDKLVGQAMEEGTFPWRKQLVMVSGRAGFELVQKCVMAGTAIMVAIGAPSSLAIELADLAGMTLIGFLKEDRFNIYTHPERIVVL